MMIESAAPAENRLREDPKRGNYVYAPEAGSFFALLSALNETGTREDAEIDVDGEAADSGNPIDTESTDGTDGTVNDADGSATESDAVIETDVEPVTTEAPGTAEAATTDTDEIPLDTATTPEEPLPLPTGPPASPTLTSSKEGTPPVVEMAKEGPPALPPVVATATEEVEVAPETNGAATEESVDPATPPLEGDIEGMAADDDTGADTRLPRTLNAHLAEKALRPLMADVATTPPSMDSDAPELNLTDHAPVVDESLPDSAPPAPQSMATELGGVKISTQTPTPRIPLTNLPGEIAQQIHLIQQEGSSTIRLRLSPENLGEIRLEVHRAGKTIRVTMISKNPQVRDALDGQLADLREALDKQGFTLDEASVEDSPPGDGDHRPFTWDFPTQEATASEATSFPTAPPPRPAAHTLYAENGLNVLA